MSGALSSVTNASLGGTSQSTGTMGTQTAAFNAAAAIGNANGGAGDSTTTGLTVNGNSIDTGRYVISASNTYTAPTSGSRSTDGMLSIYDKKTGTYVEAYGDPHVFTSGGDKANFESKGVMLNLGDGTKVEIKPTRELNGVSYIGEVAVTKGNQTVTQSGIYGGTATTSAITQGGPSSSQGFNDANDTVLSAGQDGSIGTLYSANGNALNSKASEQSLDNLGSTPTSSGSQQGSTSASTAATEQEINLLQQLISMLQNQLSSSGGNADTKSLISQLEQLVSSLLSGNGGDKATTINNLLPALEQALGQLGQGGQGSSSEASLINQVISALMGQSDGTTSGTTASGGTSTGGSSSGTGSIGGTASQSAVPDSYNPSHGISGAEIDQMLAHAGGSGAEVDYSAWDTAVSNFAKTDGSLGSSSNQNSGSSSQTGSKTA